MIESLKIKNVALLRDVTINFANGFNVLLGETGAGKSIILDALNFVLGAKADKELITYGEEFMRVEAVFSSYSPVVSQTLEQLGFEDEGILIINRLFSPGGKSEVRVNGNACTLNMLKEITKYLADSYSQHENLLLLKPKNHLKILDSLNPEILSSEKQELEVLIKQLQEINSKIKALGGSGVERERQLDLLKYQIQEIEEVSPTVQEELDLQEKINFMSNAEKIANSLSEGLNFLSMSDMSALNLLRQALRNFENLQQYTDTFAPLNERLASAFYELEDVAATYADHQDTVYFNQNEFDKLDAKLDKYKLIKKKYGSTVQEVLQFLESAHEEFDLLTNAAQTLENLETEKDKLNIKIESVCASLTEKRKTLAKTLSQQIVEELAFLGMKNVQFEVRFEKAAWANEQGNDEIEFLFSANAGVEVKPLSKIISGGEMSRFSLALKNIVKDEQACLVFDEIDAGISGQIGRAVAERIATLAANNQVICISHSAQVCAMADKFFHVKKSVEGDITTTSVTQLDDQQIINQLAIMGSGKQVSQVSLDYASQLLTSSRNFKKSIK